MKNECSGLHSPNYKTTCCLRHLVEMAKHADIQLSMKKYARLLLTTLNHNFKNDRLQYTTIKLDLFLNLIDIITKYMSHFFINNKLDYAKLLGIIAMKFFEGTAFKDNPEVILREIATNNNISCIYEAKGKSKKAFYYLNKNKQYISTSSNLDNAILYNNLIRIGLQLNKKDEIVELFKAFSEALDEEKNSYKNTTMKQVIEMSMTTNSFNKVISNPMIQKETNEKFQMLSYLYFNQGVALVKYGMIKEGNDALRKGYEFSMSTLGENHLYTQKFAIRLYAKKMQDFHSDPEKEYCQTASFNRAIDRRKFHNHNSNTQLKKCYSVSKISGKEYPNDTNSTNNNNDEEYKRKLDMIYDYVQTINQNDRKLSQSETGTSSSQFQQRSASQSRYNSYTNFKKVLKPFLQKCIDQNVSVDQILLKGNKKDMKTMMDEFYKEYQNEFKNAPKRTSVTIKPRENIVAEDSQCIQKVNQTMVTKTEQSIDDTQYKKPLKIKKLFDKVCVIREPKETKLGKLFSELVNDNNDKPKPKPIAKPPVTKEKDTVNKQVNNNQKNLSGNNNSNNNSFNSKFTFQDQASDDGKPRSNIQREEDPDLKGLVAKDAKAFTNEMPSFKITIAETEELNTLEFKPFYSKNEAYNKTVQSLTTEQKSVKFLRKSNNTPMNSFQDILSGAVKQVSSNDNSSQMNQCHTFALPTSNQISIPLTDDNQLNESMDLEICSQASERVTNLLLSEDNLIESECSIDESNSPNYLMNKTKNVIDQSVFFENLRKVSSLEKMAFCISMLIPFQKDYYKILISHSGLPSQPIVFKLYHKDKPKDLLTDYLLDQVALKNIVQKIYLYHALARNVDLHQLLTFEDLIKKIIVYHCLISLKEKDKESKFSIGISPKPNGLCGNKQIALRFLKNQCSIEILVIEDNSIRLNITDQTSKDIYLQIDCRCDKTSFDDIVTSLSNHFPKEKDETYIPSYKLNEKHVAKNGIVQLLLKKTQEIIRQQSNDSEISFANYHKQFQGNIIQCKVDDCCNQISFFVLSMNQPLTNRAITVDSSLYQIDYWYLSRVNGDETTMLHATHPIILNTLTSLINCNHDLKDYTQILKLSSKRDIIITNYLLLNSFNCNHKHLKELYSIEGISKFNYMTRITKDYDHLLYLTVIEMSQETKVFYAKMIYYNKLTNYEYAIILLPQCDFFIEDLLKYLNGKKKKKSLGKGLIEVFREYIEMEGIPMVKYLPMSILLQKYS